VSNTSVETICDACQQGKSHQLAFSESSHVVKLLLSLCFLMCGVLPKHL
jgi:hypothetical protein